MSCKITKKSWLMIIALIGIILCSIHFTLAVVNNTLKDQMLPYVNVEYDFVNGTIDEIRIFNRTLTSAEINENYGNSPQATGEIWNCTINATDATGAAGLSNTTVTDYIRTKLTGYVLEAANRLANALVIIINQSDNKAAGNTLTNSTGGWDFDVNVNGYYMVAAYFNNTLRGAASPYIRAN